MDPSEILLLSYYLTIPHKDMQSYAPPNDTVLSEPSNPQTHSSTDYLTAKNAGYSIALLAAIYGLNKSLPYFKKALRARGVTRNEENADYAAIDGAKLLS